MSAIAPRPAAFALRLAGRPIVQTASAEYLRLRACEDGWSLIGASGKVVFHALGLQGRRRCLEYARAHGILAVLS